MKIFIKSMIYSLFLATSLNIAPVMAGGHGGNSQSSDNANQLGIDGQDYGSDLELWARDTDFEGIARDSQNTRTRPLFLRPSGRPTR